MVLIPLQGDNFNIFLSCSVDWSGFTAQMATPHSEPVPAFFPSPP